MGSLSDAWCSVPSRGPIPGESFFGTSAEITFQHRNRRFLTFLPKTEKIADNFQFCRNGVFMGCAYL